MVSLMCLLFFRQVNLPDERRKRRFADWTAGEKKRMADANPAKRRLIEIVIAAFLAVMVVMVFGNVVLRYAFNSGIIASEEVSRWLFL